MILKDERMFHVKFENRNLSLKNMNGGGAVRNSVIRHRRADGRTYGSMGRWTDGQTDGRTDGRTDRWTDGQTEGRTDILFVYYRTLTPLGPLPKNDCGQGGNVQASTIQMWDPPYCVCVRACEVSKRMGVVGMHRRHAHASSACACVFGMRCRHAHASSK